MTYGGDQMQDLVPLTEVEYRAWDDTVVPSNPDVVLGPDGLDFGMIDNRYQWDPEKAPSESGDPYVWQPPMFTTHPKVISPPLKASGTVADSWWTKLKNDRWPWEKESSPVGLAAGDPFGLLGGMSLTTFLMLIMLMNRRNR